ncbi:MAG: SRPBCC family protein [Elusimicrobia bacterium]|nr:SRPBCC family protein [Elusimicrobiota bacterium]
MSDAPPEKETFIKDVWPLLFKISIGLAVFGAAAWGAKAWWGALALFAGLIGISVHYTLRVMNDPGKPVDGEATVAEKMASAAFSVLATGAIGSLLFVLLALVNKNYGFGLFVLAPTTLGFFAAAFHGYRKPRTRKQCAAVTGWTMFFAFSLLMAFAWEGLICILMASPIILLLGLLGSEFGFRLQAARHGAKNGVMLTVLLLNPAFAAIESRVALVPPVQSVRTTLEVDAPPETVWKAVVGRRRYRGHNLLFRAGVNHPVSSELVRVDGAYFLKCRSAEGEFLAPVSELTPARELAFRLEETPAPMKEMNLQHVDAPHLHGYFNVVEGRFSLKPLPGGRTELSGSTKYQYAIWPVSYWRLWTDRILDRMHRNVLEQVKETAEMEAKS